VAPFVVIARDAIMDEHDLSLFSLFFEKKKQREKKLQIRPTQCMGGA
jgi:hypothetical protein